MDVAVCLGVDDLTSPLMAAARAAWPGWCAARPELAVVDDLEALPDWTRQADVAEKGRVLAVLAALTAEDANAVTALAWLLVPGATRIAATLTDLHPDVGGLVAGQLWIEARRAHELAGHSIAAEVLRRTRREVCAELGVGDAARRRDRVWAESVRVETGEDVEPAADGYESEDMLFERVTELMMDAIDDNAIHVFDAWLLCVLASLAARLEVAGHRGRMGLTTPAVIDELAGMVHLSARAIRRRAATALDRLAEFVEVRASPARFAVWRARHTSCPVTPAEEMQLVITEDADAQFFRVRDLPPGAWAPDVGPERRRSGPA